MGFKGHVSAAVTLMSKLGLLIVRPLEGLLGPELIIWQRLSQTSIP